MSLSLSQIIPRAHFSWLIQPVNVSHDEDVGAVELDQFVDATNVVTVHQQSLVAVDCH